MKPFACTAWPFTVAFLSLIASSGVVRGDDIFRIASTPPDSPRAKTQLDSRNVYVLDTWSDRSLQISTRFADPPPGRKVDSYSVTVSDLELQDELPIDGSLWVLSARTAGNRSASNFVPFTKVFDRVKLAPDDVAPPSEQLIACPIKGTSSIQFSATEGRGAQRTLEVIRVTYEESSRQMKGELTSSRVRYNAGERQEDGTNVSRFESLELGTTLKFGYLAGAVRVKSIVRPDQQRPRLGWIVFDEVEADEAR